MIETTDRYCPSCGAAVNAGAQNVPDTPGAPQVQNAQYAQNAAYVQNTQYAQNAPQVQNAQYMPNAPHVQNAQYAQGAQYAPNAQNVPMQPPGYAYGMHSGGVPPYPNAGAFGYQPPLTRKEFFAMYASDKVRKGIRSSAILCYVCAVLTVLYGWLTTGTLYSLLDAAVIVLLGVLIHVIRSRAAAVILLVYSSINLIYTWVNTGSPGGWLMVVGGIAAVSATFSLNKEYKAYHGQ